MRRSLSLIFSLVFILSVPLAARAVDTTFISPNGYWSIPASWSPQKPDFGDTVYILNNHIATYTGGVEVYDALHVGTETNSGHLRIEGGQLGGYLANISASSLGTSSVVVQGGIWAAQNISLTGDGGSSLYIEGGVVQSMGNISLGASLSGSSVINVNSGTLAVNTITSLHNTGTVNFNGGTLQALSPDQDLIQGPVVVNVAANTTIDTQDNAVSLSKGMTGSGGIIKAGSGNLNVTGSNTYLGSTRINSGTLSVGTGGSVGTAASADVVIQNGALHVNGGVVTGSNVTVAESNGSAGSMRISSGTVGYSGTMTVGGSGTAAVTIKGGVLASSMAQPYPFNETAVTIGDQASGHGEVLVEDFGSRWINEGSMTIGEGSSGNTLTITDQALVQSIGINISLNDTQDNFIRLKDGYFALFGSRTAHLQSLITEGHIQLWNGAEWTSAPLWMFEITEYADSNAGEAAALADTGYSGLRYHTVVTTSAVPEPTTWALMGLAASYFCYRHIRRRKMA